MHHAKRLTATVVLFAFSLVGTAGAASAAGAPGSSLRPTAVGAATGVAPAAAASAATTSATTAATGAAAVPAGASVPAGPAGTSAVASPLSIARAIIAVIKRFGGWFSKLYSAVKAGYTAYRNFINNLPWYIKYPVKAISPLVTAYDVWAALNSLL